MNPLQEIKNRAEAATAGPWTPQDYDTNPGDQGVAIIGGGELGSMEGHLVAYALTLSDEPQCVSDGDFIAHARADVPKLINALERVEAVALMAEQMLAYGAGGIHMADAIRKQIAEAIR